MTQFRKWNFDTRDRIVPTEPEANLLQALETRYRSDRC